MFKKEKDSNNLSKKSLNKKMKSITYDEHFTRASDSIDLVKNAKFVDIGDGISRRNESDYEKFTK